MHNTTMKQPPDVISTKDMLYISDMLSWNLGAAKMARESASKVNDTEISEELNAAYQMHKQHYDRLLKFLEKHVNNNG